MFKKSACYLSLLLLVAPLVATAEDGDPAQAQTTLAQLSVNCPELAGGVDFPTVMSLQALYQQNAGQAIWTDDGRLQALQAQLQQLADDGLDPARYDLPDEGRYANAACTDIAISQRYLQALHELRFGHLPQNRLEPIWKANPQLPDRQAMVLHFAVAGLQDPAQAFELARPSLALYRDLRELYARQRQQPLADWQSVPSGPLLQPDKHDVRVPVLARRPFNEGYLSVPPLDADEHYSPSLVEAMKSFQLHHSL
ncbi:MAG: murein L,D-transpeptidase, partial [Pseudomonas sp.]